jgi:Fe-S cluster assembly protein SufD
MALPQAKIDATEARLRARRAQGLAAWARAAQEDAAGGSARWACRGGATNTGASPIPTTLNAPEAPPAAVFEDGEAPLFDGVDRLRIVFVDGVFDAEASDPLAGEGLEIERLSTP